MQNFFGEGGANKVYYGELENREWIHYLKKLCNTSWRIDL